MASTYQIINDDCIQHLVYRNNRNKFDLIFCDPPYNIGVDYGLGKKADLLPKDKYLNWCQNWIFGCNRSLKPTGSFWLLTPEELLDDFIILCKKWFTIRCKIVWVENFGMYRKNNFGKCARFLIYCVKNAKNFTFNADAIRIPSDRQLKYKDKRANPKGKIPSNVWLDIPRVAGTFKERIPNLPTQLPEKLLERIILCCSNEDDLVLDPMAGSFTTGVVALKLNRKFIGIEKSKEYCSLGKQRLKK